MLSTSQPGLAFPRISLAERWQRSITRTGAVPFSAVEVGERLLELADQVLAVLAGDDADQSAADIGRALVGMGYRWPASLSATLEVFTAFALEQATPDDLP